MENEIEFAEDLKKEYPKANINIVIQFLNELERDFSKTNKEEQMLKLSNSAAIYRWSKDTIDYISECIERYSL